MAAGVADHAWTIEEMWATPLMRCIFCKNDSLGSKTREHIIPHSLGNTEHMLPVGVVCDGCNNYFSRKLEQPILHSLRWLRSAMEIPNKRGNLPVSQDVPELPDYRLMSRFLGKVGLEVFTSKALQVAGWNEEIVDKVELDPLRNYARFNIGKEDWPFRSRTLYPTNAIFNDGEEYFEVLHEYTILGTPNGEFYSVVALFGVEFTINLGGPYLDGYERWLTDHGHQSPLYVSK